MKTSKLGACVLALATAVALCAPVAALAAPTSDTVTAAGTKQSVITGTIEATTLSVSVPTAAAFKIDPSLDATAVDTQIKDPDNYTITNSSVVPIYAHISACETTGVTLKDAVADLSADNTAMFAIKTTTDAPTDFSTTGDWLLTTITGGKYFPIEANNGKLDAVGGTNASATMNFYGQASESGWADGDTFTVKPTFTISTTA